MATFNIVRLAVIIVATSGACAGDSYAAPGPIDRHADMGGVETDVGPQTMQIATEQVKLGALTFDVVTAGPRTGTPVILLHGFPQNAGEWKHQLPALAAAGYRVIAPNQRGYSEGARPAEVSAYALSELVRDLLGIADALGAPRFHLVGHDWGASVAWEAAITVPSRVLTVSTISVPHPEAFARVLADPRSCQRQASSYFGLFTSPVAEQTLLANGAQVLRSFYVGLPAETIEEYVSFFSGPALTGGLNWYRANLARPLDPPATPRTPRKVTVPTLYVWSDEDPALCREGAVLTGEYVSGPYRFEVLEGVNHWVPEIAPEHLNTLLLEHLAAHPSGS